MANQNLMNDAMETDDKFQNMIFRIFFFNIIQKFLFNQTKLIDSEKQNTCFKPNFEKYLWKTGWIYKSNVFFSNIQLSLIENDVDF